MTSMSYAPILPIVWHLKKISSKMAGVVHFLLIMILLLLCSKTACFAFAILQFNELSSKVLAQNHTLHQDCFPFLGPIQILGLSNSTSCLPATHNYPASSCADLLGQNSSGYYWVRATDGSNLRVYCDMTSH